MQKNVKARRTKPTRYVCSFAERRKLAFGSDSSTFFFAHIRTSGFPSRRVGRSVCAKHKIGKLKRLIVVCAEYKNVGAILCDCPDVDKAICSALLVVNCRYVAGALGCVRDRSGYETQNRMKNEKLRMKRGKRVGKAQPSVDMRRV